MIGTDHAPHTLDDKKNGACGFSGIETAFSLCYTSLVLEKYIDLKRLSSLMSAEPARRLRLNKGLIRTGMDADLVLIDLDDSFEVNPENFLSKGKYTPVAGKMLSGRICKTFYRGQVVYNL
jgi:dihydroorotase